jgi:hypothetical protein
MVHKHIRSVFLLNETETFSVIKPLYSSIYHTDILLPKYFQYLKLEDIKMKNELFLQKEITPPIGIGA